MSDLIPEETLALVGELLDEPLASTISLKESQRYALAAGDLNPIYFDESAARAAGYAGIVVPPLFLAWALSPHRSLAELRQDGLYRARGKRVSLRVKRMMFAGEEWEYLAPVHPGDTITATVRLESLEEKQGNSERFVLPTTDTRSTNQHGVVVARARGRGIAR
jgi:acyl dehydratase